MNEDKAAASPSDSDAEALFRRGFAVLYTVINHKGYSDAAIRSGIGHAKLFVSLLQEELEARQAKRKRRSRS